MYTFDEIAEMEEAIAQREADELAEYELKELDRQARAEEVARFQRDAEVFDQEMEERGRE